MPLPSRPRGSREGSVPDERAPEVRRFAWEGPAFIDDPGDPTRRHLLEDGVTLLRDPRGQGAAQVLVERATGLQVVRQIEHLADVVPPGVADRVIANGIEHALIGF